MADSNVSFRQRAVIDFLVKWKIPAADIHYGLQRVYGDVCIGASSVRRWVKHFKDGTRASKISLVAVTLEQPQLNPQGCILIEFLEPRKTINAAHYVQTLLKFRRALRDKRPGRKAMLQHDNARPHTAL
jgi:hypothetical protein